MLATTPSQRTGDIGPYSRFLEVAGEAHRSATPAQRSLMRQLASTCPTPEQATDGIERIMGWK